MCTHVRALAATLALFGLAASAAAQPAPDAHEWGRGTTFAGFTGVAVDAAHTRPMLGGSVGWAVARRRAVEGSGLWVDHPADGDAFAGTLKLQASWRERYRAVPFVLAGVGLYRISTGRDADPLPTSYQRRIARDSRFDQARTFTDPTVVFGAGTSLFVGRNLALRPEVEGMIVLRESRSHLVTAFRIGVVYRIEDHPVTPSRSR